MGSPYNSCPSTNFKQRNHLSIERMPKLLKDFLTDDSNSCSSSGLKSFPRKPCDSTMKTLIEIDLINNPKNNITNPSNIFNIASYKLLKSRSKAAATTTISALQAMINAVKNIHFTAVNKSPSILPRSLSRRRLSKKKSHNKENHEVKITVTVKDIIRWRSFRDIVEEKSPPSDLPSSPQHCTTTTTGSTSTTPRSGSSWCDSDFTSDYLPAWNGNFEECGEDGVEMGKTFLPCVGEDTLEATTETRTDTKVGPEEDEEEEQHSPASVIFEFKFEEDEESSSSFDQSLATVERTREKIMEKIRRFESLAKLDSTVNLDNWMSMDENISSGEDDDDYDMDLEGIIRETNMSYEEVVINEVEEKAWKLLNQVKETGLECCNDNNMGLILDFFREELGTRTTITYESRKNGIDVKLLNKAKAWINGEDSLWVGWEPEHKREVFVRDMDREGRWNKLEEEQQELALEIENGVVGLLVDDLLLDLILC